MISMKTRRMFAGFALCFAALSATAHHSGSMFDASKPVTVRGVVKTFDWVNPHARIMVEPDSNSAQAGKSWMVEMTSTGRLSRSGWTKRSLQPGDHIEVKMQPAKDGRPIGSLLEVKNLASGEILNRAD